MIQSAMRALSGRFSSVINCLMMPSISRFEPMPDEVIAILILLMRSHYASMIPHFTGEAKKPRHLAANPPAYAVCLTSRPFRLSSALAMASISSEGI